MALDRPNMLSAHPRTYFPSLRTLKRFTSIMGSLLSAGSGVLLVGCAEDVEREAVNTAPPDNLPKPVVCTPGKEGCSCDAIGAKVECGSTKVQMGDRLICSLGHAECMPDGVWGVCVPERTEVKLLSGLRLNATTDAGTQCADPCTPDCRTFPEATTTTIVSLPPGYGGPDAGITISDGGGISIVPTVQPTYACASLNVNPTTANEIVVNTLAPVAPAPYGSRAFSSQLFPLLCNPNPPPPVWSSNAFDVIQMDNAVPGLAKVLVPIAGPVQISASLGALAGSVNSSVRVDAKDISTVNPPPVGASFSNFLPTGPVDANLKILYPYTGTMFPLALRAPLLQWSNGNQPASGGVVVTLQYPAVPPVGQQPIFQASELVSESTTAPVPTRAAQPRYQIPQERWFALEQTVNRNRATLGGTARILIQRRASIPLLGGFVTYAPKSIDINFATGQLKGTIYYKSYGTALAPNYPGAMQEPGGAFPGGQFGAATLQIPVGASAPTVAAGLSGTGGCRACHSASSDGTKLITLNASNAPLRFDLPGTPPGGGTPLLPTNSKFAFSAINYNKTRILSGSGSYKGDTTSKLYDLNSGALVTSNIPAALKAAHPKFSTNSVVFNYNGGNASPLSPLLPSGRALAMMDYNGDNNFFNFRILTEPASAYGRAAWPSFMPGGTGVVYQVERRTTPNGGFGLTRKDVDSACATQANASSPWVPIPPATKPACYTGALGELWWMPTSGSLLPTRLHRANGYDPGGATATQIPSNPATGHSNFGEALAPSIPANHYEQLYNYEPSVLPSPIGGYAWTIFTSRRLYGNVATLRPYASDPRYDGISADPTPKKLWVTALTYPPVPGTDPSWPAFYLPGQELLAGNSKAVFVSAACSPVVPAATAPTSANSCDTNLDCCSGSCVLAPPPFTSPPTKYCRAIAPGVCSPLGQTCALTSDCCGAATNASVCSNGQCIQTPPFYPDVTVIREYDSACIGEDLLNKWGLFEWQSITPGTTSIEFTAQYGDGTSWLPAVPALIGVASGADIVAPSWGTTGIPTATAVGMPRGTFTPKLRIYIKMKGGVGGFGSPTLLNVRQSLECTPGN